MIKNIELNRWTFKIENLKFQKDVTIPHTWNVDADVMDYRGDAEYTTNIFVSGDLACKKLILHFGAVYHTAVIRINGSIVGEHNGSGFTPFNIDITDKVIYDGNNLFSVVVNNTYSEEMLPHMKDFDWADDGGLIRRVELQIHEKNDISSVEMITDIVKINRNEIPTADGKITFLCNEYDTTGRPLNIKVTDYRSGKLKIEENILCSEGKAYVEFSGLNVWEPENPQLYLVRISCGEDSISYRIGLRKLEVKGERVMLNEKAVYLKGCEWMPGSNPDYGMAEPFEHSTMRLRQLKDSGCNFTRFHWQQDKSLFDWCDENGLMVQEEIPYWGYPKSATQMQLTIAKQQADEMFAAHRCHPSIICWGVGNELNGAEEDTINYVKSMYQYFKAMDNSRLVNYVSNTLSLDINRDRDDATVYGDIAMWNDYLGLWEPCNCIEEKIHYTIGKCEMLCKRDKGINAMPLLVSEFGLCEPAFSGGDARREAILESRLNIYRNIKFITGYMWFSLNDYRTCVGEQDAGRMKQRVHGSTDLTGNEKPSYILLCNLNRTMGDDENE